MNYYISQVISEIRQLPQSIKYFFTSYRRAFYVGCTGMNNLGDEAILSSLKSMLYSKIYLYQISYKKPSAGKYLRKFLQDPEFIILGGGTIIRKKKDESYLKILIDFKKRYPKSKIIILGPGVANPEFANKIGFPVDKEGWVKLLNESFYISVRGQLSRLELNSWGVKVPIKILHDPGVWYVRERLIPKPKIKKIGLNFANIGNRVFGGSQEEISKFAYAFVKKLLFNNWEVYLYPTTNKDMSYMLKEIGLSDFKELKTYNDYSDINHSLDFLESLDLFVGQRLHSIIFAACVFTPFHALEYEPKTSDFLLTSGFDENYKTRVDDLAVEKIYKVIEDLYENQEKEQQKLFSKMSKVKNDQIQVLNQFLDTI